MPWPVSSLVTHTQDEELRTQGERCLNTNHGRANVPVRYCPQCGDVVNESIPVKHCSREEHAKRRRNRHVYCLDCGEQLRKILCDAQLWSLLCELVERFRLSRPRRLSPLAMFN